MILLAGVLPTPPPALPGSSGGGRQPLEYLWEQIPGGEPVLVAVCLLFVVGGVMLVGRGAAWCGPAAAIGAVATVGVLNAMGQVGGGAAAIIIILALLSGLAFFRAARTL